MVKKGILEEAKCPWYICWTFDNPFRRLIHNPARVIGGLVCEGAKALDLGCGEGYFTVDIALDIGDTGRVYAVDLQEHMLMVVNRRIRRAGVETRVEPILADPNHLQLPEKVDFALAFWMMHEVPDKDRIYRELASSMKEGAKLLLVEPIWHVSGASWKESLGLAESVGLKHYENRRVALSRAAVLEKK